MTPSCRFVTDAASGPLDGRFSTRTQIILASCACAGMTAFLYAVDPNRHSVYPQCLLYRTTGIYCPGCGATRAAYALLHGRVMEALHDNALFVAATPFLLYIAATHLLKAWRANAWPKASMSQRLLAKRGSLAFLILFGFAVLRNLPGWPFDWLKPLAG